MTPDTYRTHAQRRFSFARRGRHFPASPPRLPDPSLAAFRRGVSYASVVVLAVSFVFGLLYLAAVAVVSMGPTTQTHIGIFVFGFLAGAVGGMLATRDA